jgi:hypothetical protein
MLAVGLSYSEIGKRLAKTSARHTSSEFVDFLAQIVVSQPAGREIHVIAVVGPEKFRSRVS